MTTVASAKAPRKPRKRELKNLTRREGVWYFQKTVNGKKEFNGQRTPFSLETKDLVIAKAKRDVILRSANGAELNRLLGRDARIAAKVSEIWAAYRLAPTVRANATTRENNISDFERLVRIVKGAEFNVEEMSSVHLDKQLVKDWQAKKLAIAAEECGEDLAKMEAKKRSMNSLLAHVQSLFSKEALDDYGKLYLPPCVAEFTAALPVNARRQEVPTQLKDEFVSGLLHAVADLQSMDAAVWTVFQLMVWGGLRNKECFHAQKDWLEQVPAGFRISMKPTEGFMPKGRSRATILPANIGAAILAQIPEGTKHLVTGRTMTDRHEACYRRLNDWLKVQGVSEDANKISYRLRKYFLNKVAEQQGMIFAQAAGGHAHMSTTQNHYTGAPKMAEPIKLKQRRRAKNAA